MRDYAASTAAGDFKKTAEEQNIEEAAKTFAPATLNGVRSIDRYKDEKKGIYCGGQNGFGGCKRHAHAVERAE